MLRGDRDGECITFTILCFSCCRMSTLVVPLWSLVLLVLSSQGNGETGVFFVQEDPAYVSYNSWIVTLTIDLAPYEDQIYSIRDEIREFERSFDAMRLFRNNSQDYRLGYNGAIRNDVTDLLNREVKLFNNKFKTILEKFRDIKMLAARRYENVRQKRSLLPFVGDVLENLFGTATEKKMKKLRFKVRELSAANSRLMHFVEESASILNTTHYQLKENRNAIIHLQNTSRIFQKEMIQIIQDVDDKVFSNTAFAQMINRIHEIFHLVSYHIDETSNAVGMLLNQIQDTVQGNLPMSLMLPKQMIAILDGIRRLIPETMTVPGDLSDIQMLLYYKFLHPVIIPENSKFHVVFGIPVLPKNSKFQIFRPVSMPIQDPQTNLSVEYILEANNLAISKATGQYSFISDKELSSCKDVPVCRIKAPLFDIENYPSCMLQLYLRNPHKIKKFCNKRIISRYPKPEIQYLSYGKWVISTVEVFPLNVICFSKVGQNHTKETKVGINILELEEGCGATSQYFEIPIYETGKINIEAKLQIENEIKLNRQELWQPTPTLFHRLKNLSEEIDQNALQLQDISDLPAHKLELLLHDLKRQTHSVTMTRDAELPTYILLILALSGFCVTIFVVYLFVKCFIVKRFRRIFKPKKPSYRITMAQEPAAASLTEVQSDPVSDSTPPPPDQNADSDWQTDYTGTRPKQVTFSTFGK